MIPGAPNAVFNAPPDALTVPLSAPAGRAPATAPASQDGRDDVVPGPTSAAATCTVTVPPRPVAVLVQSHAAPQPPLPFDAQTCRLPPKASLVLWVPCLRTKPGK